MAFYKSKYTGIEIDQRLTQATYDDAVLAGFEGSKEEFDAILGKLKEIADKAENSIQMESENLDTFNKNVVDAINELHRELQAKPDEQDVIDQGELEVFKDEIAAKYVTREEVEDDIKDVNSEISILKDGLVGRKTEKGGEIFNDYEGNSAGATYAHAEGRNVTVTGNAAHGEGIGTKATNANSHAEGNSTTASGASSHSEGYSTTASGGYSHAEGNNTQATASAAHAEGTNTIASAQNAHTEGQNNTADAAQAHAEGGNNTAHGQNSHAEGNGNTANGGSSHVEGYNNTAEGTYCHVEGGHNTASGSGSHAEGIGTTATNEGEHAEGRYNVSNNGGTNASRTVHSVGFGTSDAKRNAHEIMWNGDHYVYGLGGYNGTNYSDSQTVQEVISNVETSIDEHNTSIDNINIEISNIQSSIEEIQVPYEINLTNLLSAEDSESISTAIGGIDNLNATVQDNRIIVGTISNGNVSVSIRILGNVTTLYYLLDSILGLTLNEIAITNTSGTLSKNITTHSVLTENMVINSLNSDETTLPLSAAQGKSLNSKITDLNAGLATKQDTLTAGTGIEITPENQINVTLDTTVFKVVSALPDSPAQDDENKIYLVPAEATGVNNSYTEYVWVNSAWEILGKYTSEVDLTPYLKITDAQSTYATKTELTTHTGNTSNPHNVTKSQVGLGNVDNTSDANKPVSTAQQTALDLKQNIIDNFLETDSKTIVGAINEVNTKSGYYVNITSLNNNSSSEEISEAIGGYDNLLNALNNKIPVYVYTTNGDEQFAIIIITNAIVSQNSIGLIYDSGTVLGIYTINNNSGILSCIVEHSSMQKTGDTDLNTSSKTIVGAINELLTKVQELETKNTELESRLAALEVTN